MAKAEAQATRSISYLHIPVMADEIREALAPKLGGVYVDATFGAGGHTKTLLEAAGCQVWAIDRDPSAIALGRELEPAYHGRLTVIEGRFSQLEQLLPSHLSQGIDGMVFDLGVSSFQLDQPLRGFSFRRAGPLDMRMSARQSLTAAELVNCLSEGELAQIFLAYGNERYAKRVARAIVSTRNSCPITHTDQLANLVRSVVPASNDGLDPATRSFQALRIHVNDELDEIEGGLQAAERLLATGGRLAVIAFHSLEDRIVKRFLRPKHLPYRHLPYKDDSHKPESFRLINRRPLRPGAAEIVANYRARSARLRVAERL